MFDGQGIEAKARCQLLALALCALEEQLAALPEAAADGTAQQWRALTGALLASCSVAAARAWLGYVPAELQEQAAALAAQCQPGEDLWPMFDLRCMSHSVCQAQPQASEHWHAAASACMRLGPNARMPVHLRWSTTSRCKPALGLTFGVLASGLDGERADAESTPDAKPESVSDPKASSLWQLALEKALLHATILRALRFGDQPPPGFQRPQAAQSKLAADQASVRSSSATVSASGLSSANPTASRSDQSATAGNVPVSPSLIQNSSGLTLRSATRQQAAALLAQQPQAIRCAACGCGPLFVRTLLPIGEVRNSTATDADIRVQGLAAAAADRCGTGRPAAARARRAPRHGGEHR